MSRAAIITVAEFEQLYWSTARDVHAYVQRRSSADPEDLVAEAYAVAWRRRADLPAPALRRAWLFGVARMLLKARLRERRSESLALTEAAAQVMEPSLTDDVKDDPDERLAHIMSAALDRLSPADREVIRLSAWENLSPAEMAVVLGVRPGTARVRLHRARRALAADPSVRSLVEPFTELVRSTA